ncbi:hypothetical protein Trco_006759 [Trichoderma cornu-damae]|uniref:Uncharacterized protein n=1 Tax=Trichoderma cornu-damae TaxID=654480 RepID=A0A9P8QMF9_9HYPO|nr:hypothetical protein Trco_006759 [Trichoderma cornu-damae]
MLEAGEPLRASGQGVKACLQLTKEAQRVSQRPGFGFATDDLIKIMLFIRREHVMGALYNLTEAILRRRRCHNIDKGAKFLEARKKSWVVSFRVRLACII